MLNTYKSITLWSLLILAVAKYWFDVELSGLFNYLFGLFIVGFLIVEALSIGGYLTYEAWEPRYKSLLDEEVRSPDYEPGKWNFRCFNVFMVSLLLSNREYAKGLFMILVAILIEINYKLRSNIYRKL